jgi:hypothetical protein
MLMLSFSNMMQSELRKVRETFAHPNLLDKGTILDNLLFMYQVIIASENLLYVAIARLEESYSKLTEYEKHLLFYFRDHLEEEKGHAEWLKADLAAGGLNVDDCNLWPEALEMAGSQYYLIHHAHPSSLLGYMFLLEAFPLDLETVAFLEEQHDPRLFRTLRYHSTHDPDHARLLAVVLDQTPVPLRQLVFGNALSTARRFGAASHKFGITVQ